VLRRGVAAALAVLGVSCLLLWAGLPGTSPGGSGSPAGAPAVGAVAPAPVVAAAAAPQPRSDPQPLRLVVPGIGLDTALVGLGLQGDGTVEVPADPLRAGWYRLGPPPGAVGSAVVLGHVDSPDGPAVFARLGELDRGDRVLVTRDDGTTARFVVRSTRTYANDRFPARLVYGPHGRRELNLVTCGGDYDPERGGYQANVVVNARQVSTARTS
jgi:hypothetical protein